MNLPRTLVGRSIIIKLWPKKADERVESFSHTDDDEFFILRRKLARWAADNTAAIKDAKPLLPANFNNRAADNWKLLLVIAELAGGGWPKQARDAADRLSRTTRKPSWRVRLLAALQTIFASGAHGNILQGCRGHANRRRGQCVARIQPGRTDHNAAGRRSLERFRNLPRQPRAEAHQGVPQQRFRGRIRSLPAQDIRSSAQTLQAKEGVSG
jgi:Protein of unknown function (DUF3631)